MSALHTRPIPLPRLRPAPHEHGWIEESRHPTSEGTILYVRCVGCGSLRVDRHANGSVVPEALSRSTVTR